MFIDIYKGVRTRQAGYREAVSSHFMWERVKTAEWPLMWHLLQTILQSFFHRPAPRGGATRNQPCSLLASVQPLELVISGKSSIQVKMDLPVLVWCLWLRGCHWKHSDANEIYFHLQGSLLNPNKQPGAAVMISCVFKSRGLFLCCTDCFHLHKHSERLQDAWICFTTTKRVTARNKLPCR